MVASVQEAKTRATSANSNNQDIPSEAEMGALFEAAMQQQKRTAEPKVTPEEQTKFLSAMKDPEFRSLLNEYMQEISDPRNREETERYLSQLENEQKVPTDKQLVKPTPGFVVKTKWENAQKIFINVCSSDKMQPPSSTRVTSGQQGTSWNLPYSVGPERLEPDKGGANAPTFDVCFHPRVIEFSMTREDYRHMVISTCLDAVEPIMRESRHKSDALLARNYHVLKGVLYKSGDPVTMCLRKEHEAPESVKTKKKTAVQAVKQTKSAAEDKNRPPLETIKRVEGKADKSVLSQLTQVEGAEQSSSLMKEVSSVKLEQSGKPKKKKMEHQLIYRGRFELLHHMQADPDKNVPEDRYRPKELVVEINFPLSSSAKGLDLDVSEKMLRLSAGPSVSGNYEPLELSLPFPVIEDKGSAKFDRKNHKLIVTLPVQPPPKPKPQSVSLIVQDDEEEEEESADKPAVPELTEVHVPKPKKESDDEFRMLRETALMVANDPQIQVHKQRKAQSQTLTRPSPAVTEPAAIKDETFDDLPPLESCSDEEEYIDVEADTEEVETLTDSVSETTNPVIKPPFETHDTPTCLSYLVSVAGIDSTSVKLTFPSTSSLCLQFSDKEKQVYDMQIAVLPVEIDPATAEFDVASENMAVILEKKNAATAFEAIQKVVQLDAPAPTAALAAARFQNQLLFELD
ncbi:PIH1 family [Phytophthora cactorum]|nr:PIH1 family [Phytophthora cactorum]